MFYFKYSDVQKHKISCNYYTAWSLMIIISHKLVSRTLMMISHKGSLLEWATRCTYLITVNLTKAYFVQQKGWQMQLLMPSTKDRAKRMLNIGLVVLNLVCKIKWPRWWKQIKEAVSNKHGAILNFSGKHNNYYTPFKYVTKIDKAVCKSSRQPNLKESGSPKTKKFVKTFREK